MKKNGHIVKPRIPINPALRRLARILDKQEMALALSGQEDPALRRLASYLQGRDPETGEVHYILQNGNLASLCHRAGVTYQKAVDCFKNFKRSEAIVEAARRAPDIMGGIAEDALPRSVTCAQCEGVGKITILTTKLGEDGKPVEDRREKRCIPCEGMGKLRVAGDPIARKQILEVLELSGKASSIINAPNANILNTNGESLEDAIRAARRPTTPTLAGDTTIDGDTGKVQ